MQNGNGQHSELTIVPMSGVRRRALEWLWPGRLARGMLTLLDGDPGAGKSFLALAIATAVAHGAPFPVDSERRPPGRVLLMTAEDSLEYTIGPRLDAMGADTTRIEAISAARSSPDSEEERSVWLTEDIGAIERTLQGRLYELLVIDPLNAYIPGHVDSAKDNAVRSVLAPLVRVAGLYGVSVLAIRHLTKGSRDRAIYRGQGSIAYTAAARVVLLAGQEQNNGGRRVLMPIKCNLAPLASAVSYQIDNGRFSWGGAAEVHAESLLAPEPIHEVRDATEEAAGLLRDFLADGDQPASEAMKRVRHVLGCSVATVKRAKLDLHVQSQRRGFGRQSEVYWHLPKAWQQPLPEADGPPYSSPTPYSSYSHSKSPMDSMSPMEGQWGPDEPDSPAELDERARVAGLAGPPCDLDEGVSMEGAEGLNALSGEVLEALRQVASDEESA